ncbi:MAG: TauD/TfdA family dioxygenase [Rhodospirillaceae bacterium]|nr:TauD/TfdA family dioxygenase [Rhodospirillaceae bacterium]MBT7770074.1 TauD/TfdA family dioxygenase [Rhodospirillales bacterium]MBT4700032.1 TauD/TfdA family dioxygenase [Rhodospirillaceae bacterium]MBT5035066.1 TauD/TfdA family dioxygenase [Rhodospirillaceae bacterium]MBT6222232.1 TauD/TfdA family dioxygenase [Rhodospirillaceae bacterium]
MYSLNSAEQALFAMQNAAFQLSALSEHTGAAVEGIDLSEPVDEATRRDLNQAFAENSVLVIRNQTLTAQQFVGAVENFGDIFQQHNTRFALPECPQIHYLSNKDHYEDGKRYIPGEGYHTDHSNDAVPPKATVLLAVELPDKGGDTQYVNMHEAYEGLPDDMKERIADLKGIHVYQSKHSERKLMALSPERQKQVAQTVVHPIVKTHPVTGRKSLFINPIRIEEIIGMPDSEALPLLDELLAHAIQEKYQYRHKWQQGDLAMWDNRCLLHKANGDYDHDQTRYLYRVMLKDDA